MNQPRFNGPDYVPELDQSRLGLQHETIRDLMLDGSWRSLNEIESITGYPAASISAQLRHLRKERFGSYVVLKKRAGEETRGLFVYQVLPPVVGG
jgi:hypothetical protein